jgi:hypothetical protein
MPGFDAMTASVRAAPVPLPTNDHQKAACESATFPAAVALCTATFVAFQPTFIGVDYMAALLGNLLGTVDGLLGTATGVLGGAGASGTASAGASATADLSHTLDLGAVIETSPSIDLSAGLSGVDASVSAPTLIGASADVGHLDVGGLLHGLA